MHRQGQRSIGVFKGAPVQPDDAGKKSICTYAAEVSNNYTVPTNATGYQSAGGAYINAMFDNKPFDVLKPSCYGLFTNATDMGLQTSDVEKADRVYELRSLKDQPKYCKVDMFNAGGEVETL
jgi:hypothetical protein